ncbi:MAG: hypothetical protein H0T39_05045, partial [Actinobacteria bacterium]|nr:hypothetical protein [Actinomycetota bacterium]
SGAMRATLPLVRRIGEELLEAGTFGFTGAGLPFGELMRLVERPHPARPG